MPIRIALLVAALVLCAVPAAAQMQIDPSVPTNIPPGDRDNFKGFLDTVMDDIIATNGPTVQNAGETLWRGLAAIVVVWTGIKIAPVRHVLDVVDHRAGDRPVDPVVHAPVLRHADPLPRRRRNDLPRHDCRRRELADGVFSE